jgi:toxin FitB
MPYLLDTNVISEMRKKKPHGAVTQWFIAAEKETLLLSAVSAGEIQAGIENCRKQDPAKATELQRWLDRTIQLFNVLPMGAVEFQAFAKLMHRESNTVRDDAMIAATAIVHGLTVVTRNVGDFERFGVAVLNLTQFENRLKSNTWAKRFL